jgi:hypothetical protein
MKGGGRSEQPSFDAGEHVSLTIHFRQVHYAWSGDGPSAVVTKEIAPLFEIPSFMRPGSDSCRSNGDADDWQHTIGASFVRARK